MNLSEENILKGQFLLKISDQAKIIDFDVKCDRAFTMADLDLVKEDIKQALKESIEKHFGDDDAKSE